jgi:predicted phosphodiesterase
VRFKFSSNHQRIFIVFIITALYVSFAFAQKPIFEEIVLPAGNEYIDPIDPKLDDSDQIITRYEQFPDTVRQKIEYLLPRGDVEQIDHWGPFRYTVIKRFPEGHSNQIFIYLDGRIHQIYYLSPGYFERPRQFFIKGEEKKLKLSDMPELVMANARRLSRSNKILRGWSAPSEIGDTYVIEVTGFQGKDTLAFAFRPDGVLKTMGIAGRMRTGVSRKWTTSEIDTLLGKYQNNYGVKPVINKIQAVPFDPDSGFRFIVFGDNRINRPVWEAVCKSISKKNALFAIATGDLVNEGEPEQFDEYLFGVLEKHGKFNFLPGVGNHDTGYDRLAVSYTTSFGPNSLNYYFDYGKARFIILDNCSRIGKYSERLKMADEWLGNTPEGYFKFVFAHVPPGDIKKWEYHAMNSERSRQFTDLMTRHSVDHVFLGHIHAYSTARHQNVDYTVTGGAGAKVHMQFGPKGSVHHYVIVDVKPGEIKQQLVQLRKIE